MPYLSSIILALSLLSLLVFIVILVQQDFRQKQQLVDYNVIRHKIERLRLFQMIVLLGIDFDKYMQRVPQMEKLRHIYNCQACRNIGHCENCLQQNNCMETVDFCPNAKSLENHIVNFNLKSHARKLRL